MHRIDDPTAVATLPAPRPAGTPGYFTGGSPGSGGFAATVVRYEFMNAVQEEICNVIAAGGITLDKTNNSQLLAAIRSMRGMQVFTNSGTFTVPTGITRVKVTVVGGGCAGGHGTPSQSASGGSGGGAAIKFCTVTPGQAIVVTVGAGGVGATTEGNNGSAGGTSSFGAFCSATGGLVGPGLYSGGASGTGSGGDINVGGGTGGDASVGTNVFGGGGGNSIFGGSGRAGTAGGAPGQAPGAGGGGSYAGTPGNGGNGAAGIVIVEW